MKDIKFWTEDIKDLFCSLSVVPTKEMSLEDQLNTLTRLVIIIFLILLVVNYRGDILFLTISILFIIILYYIKKRMNNQKNQVIEHYGPTDSRVGPLPISAKNGYDNMAYTTRVYPTSKGNVTFFSGNAGNPTTLMQTSGNNLLCQSSKSTNLDDDVYNNPTYMSENQKLANGTMERTRIPPIIAPPIADSDYWKPNDFVYPQAINSQGTVELYRSGYISTDKKCKTSKINFPTYEKCECTNSSPELQQGKIVENYTDYYPYRTDGIPSKTSTYCNSDSCESPNYNIGPDLPGEVIDSMGYYPNNIRQNIPNNLAVGQADLDPAFKNYNSNTFTSIIQPGVYYKSEVIEPISSNMGISFTQQFEPVTCEKGDNDSLKFVSHDPRIKKDVKRDEKPFHLGPDASNVYDPRHYGSGTSYRTYVDKLTGQPKFYYDDINAIRMPNYITRNKIDFTEYGTSYGPMRREEFTDQQDVRSLANATFVNDTLQQRTDLQERLMRKINVDSWQQKEFPIHKMGSTRGGGGFQRLRNA